MLDSEKCVVYRLSSALILTLWIFWGLLTDITTCTPEGDKRPGPASQTLSDWDSAARYFQKVERGFIEKQNMAIKSHMTEKCDNQRDK